MKERTKEKERKQRRTIARDRKNDWEDRRVTVSKQERYQR
jgi:hypothetical protein